MGLMCNSMKLKKIVESVRGSNRQRKTSLLITTRRDASLASSFSMPPHIFRIHFFCRATTSTRKAPREVIMTDNAETIRSVFKALIKGDQSSAKTIAHQEYPFISFEPAKRSYTELQSTHVFIRDGFVDRYSGQRLVFPGALRLLSIILPVEFPAHPNWKMCSSPILSWELFPSFYPIFPVP